MNKDELILKEISVKDLRNMIENAVETKIKNLGIMMPNFEEPLVKLPAITKMFNVSVQSIHNWQNKGLIPYYKVDRATYYKKSEVMAAIQKIN